MSPAPTIYFRDDGQSGGELVLPAGAGSHVVVPLTERTALQLVAAMAHWLRSRELFNGRAGGDERRQDD